MQWRSHWGCKGGRALPLTAKNLPKSGKRLRGKIRKIAKKEEKSGRKGKNREGSFTLPLLTDRAGCATAAINVTDYTPIIASYQINWCRGKKLDFHTSSKGGGLSF